MRKISTILLVSALLVVISTSIGAEEQEVSVEKKVFWRVEWSNSPDKTGLAPCLGGAAPEQVLWSFAPHKGCTGGVPPLAPFPANTFNYGGGDEVDATANKRDAKFQRLILNTADLLVSFGGDAGNWAVWYETPAGVNGCKWDHDDIDGCAVETVDDLDGVEIYGPQGADDADYYSERDDLITTGFSVLSMAAGNYVPHAHIVAAITLLGWVGNPDSVDLDGLMVRDNCNNEWDTLPGYNGLDTIIFSIRATGNWDGGEIVVLPSAAIGAQAPFPLTHGGHVWNTAFPVAVTFGVGTEEVDAIEAWTDGESVPALTNWGLLVLLVLLVISGIIVIRHRRRAAVRA